MNATIPLPPVLGSVSPFRCSPEVRRATPAVVRGELPAWLHGELVRTCPAVFETSGWRADHWFDGLGMLYAFRIGEAGVAFRSRLLESEAAEEITHGRARMGSFGTPTGRSFWQRVFEPVPRITDNTNVNIVKVGDTLVAMTEGDRQLRIDEDTLGTLGAVEYERDGLEASVMTAHPHFDFEQQRVVNVATTLGASPVISIYEHGPGDRRRVVVGAWPTKRVPYIHAFGLTPRHAILIAHPFSVKPLHMLWSNRGYIDHFDWRPLEGTRLLVVDRQTGDVREHHTEAMFVFHTVNAFEQDGETVLDVLAYENADVVETLRVDRMIARLPDLRPSLVRIRMQPGRAAAVIETLSDVGFEFPSTNYRRVNGRGYRYAWGAAGGPRAEGGYASSVVKVDVHTGASASFADDERVYGEPVFVARPGARDEDDGVLLAVGSRKTTDTSALAVIDAKTMALVASAEVPVAIPLGFHGSFVRSQG